MNRRILKYKSLNEGESNPDDVALDGKLQSALLSNFSNVEYQVNGKNNKSYDYSQGYIYVSNSYQTNDWKWLDTKRSSILQNCNVEPLHINAFLQYSEIISKAKPKSATGYIGISGYNYINNILNFNLKDPQKVNLNNDIQQFIKNSQKSPINDDLIKKIIMNLQSIKTDYKHINTRDQGIGSAASVHITKSYDSVYTIKNLDIALDKTKEEVEQIIKSHFLFSKSKLVFDWKKGLLYKNGMHTEVWD